MRDAAKKILNDLGYHDAEVSILLVNDHRIKQLNQLHRDVNKSTDVLAYPMQDGEGKGINPSTL